jgi:hypothetical protein
MTTIIAPDVCRYSFNGTYLGRPCVNVLDRVVHPNEDPGGRAASVERVARLLIDAYVGPVLGLQSTQYSLNSVSWVDLDSADGTTGSVSAGETETLPQTGTEAGDPYTASVGALVHKQVTRTRGTRNGSWTLAGMTEQFVNGNVLTTFYLDGLNENLATFLEAITETGVASIPQRFPTVVHTHTDRSVNPPVVEYIGNSQIHTLEAVAQLASQRRRNRG